MPSADNGSPGREDDTTTHEYAERLRARQSKWWKRVLPVQAPYRWNLRRLHLGRTLDVGCGIGRNLANLDDAIGVDHNSDCIAIAKERKRSPAYTVEEFLASTEATAGAFDSLLFAHVLERMPHDDAVGLVRLYLPYVRPGRACLLRDAPGARVRLRPHARRIRRLHRASPHLPRARSADRAKLLVPVSALVRLAVHLQRVRRRREHVVTDPTPDSARSRWGSVLAVVGSVAIVLVTQLLPLVLHGGLRIDRMRSYFSFDQWGYLAIVRNVADGLWLDVEPDTETGSNFYPHGYYTVLGLVARATGMSPIAAWNVIGLALLAALVGVLGVVLIRFGGRAWYALLAPIPFIVGTFHGRGRAAGRSRWRRTRCSGPRSPCCTPRTRKPPASRSRR